MCAVIRGDVHRIRVGVGIHGNGAHGHAARRVGRYLLMQLLVNVIYALPIGVGLWLIGIPNPILWALLCGTLRFVPYIGPIVASFFPLALSIAVDPGWNMLILGLILLTIAVFYAIGYALAKAIV